MEKTSVIRNYHVLLKFDPGSLPPGEAKMFNDSGKIVNYKKNAVIYEEGSNPKGVYWIIKGIVKANIINADGREQIFFIFAQHELFGYRPLLSNERHAISTICLVDCEIKFIDAEVFLNLINSSATFSRYLLKRACHEFTIFVNRINIFAQKGIRERLAYSLLVLNEKFMVPNSMTEVSNIVISKTGLAAYVGSSLDVVSRNLKYYAEKKIIRTHGKSIFIIDFDYLLKMSGITLSFNLFEFFEMNLLLI